MPDPTQSTGSRALITALYSAAVEGAAPFPRTRDAVRDWLHGASALRTNDAVTRVHVMALGKASASMTAGALSAVETAPFMQSAGGIVVTSHTPNVAEWGPSGAVPADIEVHIGDHPVPGPASLDAADAIGEAVQRVESGDVVLVLLSGGTTALTAAPLPELSQQVGDAGRAQAHIANLAQTLLESGLAIHEMNAIRRRVLRWSAGRSNRASPGDR